MRANKRRWWSLLLLTALIVPASGRAQAAEDWGPVYGYVTWTSDYRFYGASESNRHATEQAGLHWAAPDNFYAGVFVSGVDYKDYRNTSYEVDLYAGKHFTFDGNDLNLQALYSMTPDAAGHPSYAPPGAIYPGYNFFEAQAELTRRFGKLELSGKGFVAPRPDSHGGLEWSANGTVRYPLTDWLKASASLGYTAQETRPDGMHWDIGATATWRKQWDFDLRYYATDFSKAECYFQNWCAPAVVAKVTYSFVVL